MKLIYSRHAKSHPQSPVFRLSWHRLAPIILMAMLLNLAIAPLVYAAAGASIDRGNAYALGLLIAGVLLLGIYLAVVIIQPERF
ncbi:potassium-transporting ATPase subunit F [Sodalinema gerasimenkoae]|uniref:potassium-transporting ATPase subunit F n=1 Tax=Sodalinema gerasimenkoae TaxID=2862348 RepID=UPI00120CF826|nr:potassium-transporting ATPase subunit F [Sodalinema gerasimenkoae]TAO03579.1 MAG: potassium-transporting ATPase subunit F [Phormidium sp. SL48-SHIP]